MNTRKTWNTDFIIVCQNWIGPYSWIWIQFLFSAFIWLGFFYLESIAEFLRWLAFEKKAISILAENLNSGGNYLFTVVQMPDEAFFSNWANFADWLSTFWDFHPISFISVKKPLLGRPPNFILEIHNLLAFVTKKDLRR